MMDMQQTIQDPSYILTYEDTHAYVCIYGYIYISTHIYKYIYMYMSISRWPSSFKFRSCLFLTCMTCVYVKFFQVPRRFSKHVFEGVSWAERIRTWGRCAMVICFAIWCKM